MTRKKLNSLLALAVLVLGSTSLAMAQREMAVVVSPKNSQSGVSMAELRKLVAGEKRYWQDGSAVKIFTRSSGTTEHDAMLKLLGMSETEYKQYWRTRVYQGEAEAEPASLPSNGMQREALQAYAGGIALVDSADIKPGMKVLKIDGKMPGENGYPVH